MTRPYDPARPPMATGRIESTQVRHPWRATARTVGAATVAFLPVLPVIVDELGIAGVGWVGTILAVTGGVTRALANPRVEAWLRDHLRGLLSAEPGD